MDNKESIFVDHRFIYGNRFPNPFFDIASTYLPRNIKQSFAWSEYLYFTNGILRAATERIVQYFITDLQFKGNSENTKRLKETLEKKLNMKYILTNIGIDYLVYGNSVTSIYFPFIRMLKCPNCKIELSAEKVDYEFLDYKYVGRCLCGDKVTFEAFDHKKPVEGDINIIRLDPKTIDINYNMLAGKAEYFWEIPPYFKNQIQMRNKFVINTTQQPIIDAIKQLKTFKFDSEYIFHIKNPIISGLSLEWGFPLYLNIMKLNFYNVLLRRANEAIALDFVVPFRMLTPGQSSPNADPVATYNLLNFVSEMQQMVTRHRFDPADIQVAPFPVNYQAFGAEKKALDVTDEIKAVIEEQLHSLNFPAELFFNTLNFQAMGPALRLFENTWNHLVSGLNNFLQWTVNHICDFMRWQREEVSLTRVTFADDMERRQVFLQLAAGQQISMMSALKAYNLDFANELKQKGEEAKIMAEVQKDMQQDAKMQQQLSEQPTGGSPMDMKAQAQQIAQQWLSMPYEMRKSEMLKMQHTNYTLYTMAKDTMEKMKQQQASQQAMQQQQMMMSGMQQAGGMGMPPGQPPM